jgi:ParB family chromosome partitioning protein
MKNAQLSIIAINKLIAHPDNPNVMSGEKFRKLVRNIERTGLYEPIIVRPHPQNQDKFQIINGHHRVKALEKLGKKEANCLVWNVDDRQTAILLTTLNRLSGADDPAKKIELLRKLKERFDTAELAKLLPDTAKQIEQLTNLKLNPGAP